MRRNVSTTVSRQAHFKVIRHIFLVHPALLLGSSVELQHTQMFLLFLNLLRGESNGAYVSVRMPLNLGDQVPKGLL